MGKWNWFPGFAGVTGFMDVAAEAELILTIAATIAGYRRLPKKCIDCYCAVV
jgi:hypothetical protein